MDEIHEELKQPITYEGGEDESDEEDEDAGNNEQHLSGRKHRSLFINDNQERKRSIDSNSSSQSEDFYETCDSGLSSDQCSAEIIMPQGDGDKANVKQRLSPSRISGGKHYKKLQQSSTDQNVKGI